jgi:hypothetical protein
MHDANCPYSLIQADEGVTGPKPAPAHNFGSSLTSLPKLRVGRVSKISLTSIINTKKAKNDAEVKFY